MKEHRDSHPHKDPRQPRNNSIPGTNPPVFAWKPTENASDFTLTVARDAAFSDVCFIVHTQEDPLFLPKTAFSVGTYFWKWSDGSRASEVFSFEITNDAVILEVPSAAEWFKRMPASHPRIYLSEADIEALRTSRTGTRAETWKTLEAAAEEILAMPHEIAEPPFLPDRNRDYDKWYSIWLPAMWDSRHFVQDAELLALAWLASGEEKYAKAACQRMASISKWDPDGSSYLGHNDEAHMSVIWNGSKVCDWVWDQFTDEQRELVINQFRRRGEITYEHMHDLGSYGISRFDSHAGREIVFLALLGITFHDYIPEAQKWLEWLRPVLCGIWPIWAGDDGAWAEGPSYGLAYVDIMTMFATALKSSTGVDLYKRPFWANHAKWRQWCLPPYAEWIGFGDHTERWSGTWNLNANLCDVIQRNTGTEGIAYYVEQFRQEAKKIPVRHNADSRSVSAQLYLTAAPAPIHPAQPDHVLHVCADGGWAAIRTDRDNEQNDLAFIFRSSPFGAVSHSHASNNDFAIHVAGKIMAMPSGYYCGYGSAHHVHWNWHTRSHNCLTLSEAGQLMRSYASTGAIENQYEDDTIAYMMGNADASYSHMAERCRRHVLLMKEQNVFFLLDEYRPLAEVAAAMQWNIHSWAEFNVDETSRTFSLTRDTSVLRGHFLYHNNAFFTQTEGWDPPFNVENKNEQWQMQYHLRFTPCGVPATCRNLGVLLCPEHPGLPMRQVVTDRMDNMETARIGEDRIFVNQGSGITCKGVQADAIAAAIIAGQMWAITDTGLSAL